MRASEFTVKAKYDGGDVSKGLQTTKTEVKGFKDTLKTELSDSIKASMADVAKAVRTSSASMTDSIKSDMKDVVGSIHMVVSAIDGMADRLESEAKAIRAEFQKVSTDLVATGEAAKRTGFDAGKTLSSISQGLTRTGAALTASLTAPIGLLAKTAFDTAVRFDSLERGIKAVDGGASGLQSTLRKLDDVARLPGLGMEEARKGYINLRAAGIAADTTIRSLKGFGNALATVGKGKADLDGVVLALGQIATKGMVMGQDIRQIQERVPQIRQVMIKAFGTADTEILQKAKITSAQFIDIVSRELLKLPQVTSGIQNDLENFSDDWKRFLVEIGKALIPLARQIMGIVGPVVHTLSDWFRGLGQDGQKSVLVVAGLAAAFGPLLIVAGQLAGAVGTFMTLSETIVSMGGLGAIISGLGATLSALLVPVGLVIAAAVAIYEAWVHNWGGVRDFVFGVGREIVNWWNSNLPLIRKAVANVVALVNAEWNSIKPVVMQVIDFVATLWDGLKGVVLGIMRSLGGIIKTVLAVIALDWKGALEGLRDVFAGVWDGMKSIVYTVLAGILEAVKLVCDQIAHVFGRTFTGLDNSIALLRGKLRDLGKTAGEAFQGPYAPGKGPGVGFNSFAAGGASGPSILNGGMSGAIGGSGGRRVGVRDLNTGKTTWMTMGDNGSIGPLSPSLPSAAGGPVLDAVAMAAANAKKKKPKRGRKPKGTPDDDGMGTPYDWIEEIPGLKELFDTQDKYVAGMAKQREAIAALNDPRAKYAQMLGMELKDFKQLTKAHQDAAASAYYAKEYADISKLPQGYGALGEVVKSVGNAYGDFAKKRNADFNAFVNDNVQQIDMLHATTDAERIAVEMRGKEYAQFTALQKAYIAAAKLRLSVEQQIASLPKSYGVMSNVANAVGTAVKDFLKDAGSKYRDYIRELTLDMTVLGSKSARAALEAQLVGQGMTKDQARIAAAFKEYVEKLTAAKDQLKQFGQSLGDVFASAFENMLNGSKDVFRSILDGVRDLARQIIVEWARAQIVRGVTTGLGNILGGGGGGPKAPLTNPTDIAKAVSGVAMGMLHGFALGGVPPTNTPIVVGEHGPEIITLGQPSRVYSTGDGPGMGGTVVHQNITVYTQDAQSFLRSEGQVGAAMHVRALRAAKRNAK